MGISAAGPLMAQLPPAILAKIPPDVQNVLESFIGQIIQKSANVQMVTPANDVQILGVMAAVLDLRLTGGTSAPSRDLVSRSLELLADAAEQFAAGRFEAARQVVRDRMALQDAGNGARQQ